MTILDGLRARRSELETAIVVRVRAIADLTETADPAYLVGFGPAVSAALDYGFSGLASGDIPSVPVALLGQARLAARNDVSLDTVLRRYCVGNSVFSDALVEEAEAAKCPRSELKRCLSLQASSFDHLIATVSEEHRREQIDRGNSREVRRARKVERLLDGDLVATSELFYDFKGHHLALIAFGPDVSELFRKLALSFGCGLLLARPDEQTTWGWLCSRRAISVDELETRLPGALPCDVLLTVGEPAQNVAGWRLSHRQASAALHVGLRGPSRLVRYSNVALVASMIQDDLLTTSLRKLFLDPLTEGREDGEVAFETLRAYFAAERNVSSAAAALGISRQSVTKRLRTIEAALDRTINSCGVELDLALRLEELDAPLHQLKTL